MKNNMITVSPENGRHFVIKARGPLDLSVVYHLKNLLTRREVKREEYPVLAWVTVDGYKNCVQGLYYGNNVFNPSPTDDFYYKHSTYFRTEIRQNMGYSTIEDCIRLIKKFGIKNG